MRFFNQQNKYFGNDTIDPYPLIPKEAIKILIVKKDIFEEIAKRYETFCLKLAEHSNQKTLGVKSFNKIAFKTIPIDVVHKHIHPYEPSTAIAVNECDYRRWCRVKEWFAQFGLDAEEFERTVHIK